MPAAARLAGRVFGRLKVLATAERRGRGVWWLCRCDCGREVVVPSDRLLAKRRPTRSCGCLVSDAAVQTQAARKGAVAAVCVGCGVSFRGYPWQKYHSRACFRRATGK